MSLYYEQDLNFREIAEILGVGEARACLDAVAICGLDLDDTWASPSRLADTAGEWLEFTAPDLRDSAVAALRGRIRMVASLPTP